MGGGKSKSSDSTTVQKTEPPEFQLPYLTNMVKQAGAYTGFDPNADPGHEPPFSGPDSFYGTIYAPNYYQGQTVAGQDPYTLQAIQAQADRAQNGSPLNAASGGQLLSTLGGNYLKSPVRQYALDTISQGGRLPSFLQGYQGNGQGSWDDPGAQQAAISQWRGGQNGYLDSMVNRAQNQTLANTAAGFSKSGRYGSGAHEAAAHDAAGNVANQMYGQAYEGDQNRDLAAWQAYTNAQVQNANLSNLAANRSLDAYNQAANRDLSAWSQNQSNLLNAYNQGQDRSLTAQNLLQTGYDRERGNMMNAMQFSPTLANQDYQDIASLSEAGAAREGYDQSLINAAIDKYNYEQSIPLTAMKNYGSMISGNYGSTTTNTAKGAQGSSNPLGGIMSGIMGGAALGGNNMMGFGSGYGALGGGILGGLSSLF